MHCFPYVVYCYLLFVYEQSPFQLITLFVISLFLSYISSIGKNNVVSGGLGFDADTNSIANGVASSL